MKPAGSSRSVPFFPTAAPLAAAVLILGAAFPGRLRAGELPLPRPPDLFDGGWRLGPVRVRPVLRLKEFGYDSNLFLTPESEAVSDFTGRIIAGVEGRTPLGRRAVLSFEALPEYLFFARHSGGNAFGWTARARGDLFLRSLSFFAAGERIDTTERQGNEIDQRTPVEIGRFSAGAGLRLERRLSFTAVLESRSVRYPGSEVALPSSSVGHGCASRTRTIGDLLDRDEPSGSLRAAYRLRGESSAFVEWTQSRSDFSDCSDRDARSSALQLGLRSDPRAPLSLEIRAGPSRLDTHDPSRPDFHGVLGEAAVNWKPTDNWKLTAGAGRALPFSIVASNLYAEEDRVSAGVLRSLTGRFAVEAGGERVRMLWPKPLPGPEGMIREDRVQTVFVGGRARMQDRGELSLRIGVRRRSSTIPGESDSQVTILTGASF